MEDTGGDGHASGGSSEDDVGPAPGWTVAHDGAVEATPDEEEQGPQRLAAGDGTAHPPGAAPVGAFAVAADGSVTPLAASEGPPADGGAGPVGPTAEGDTASPAAREVHEPTGGDGVDPRGADLAPGGAVAAGSAARAFALASRTDRAVAREARRRSRQARRETGTGRARLTARRVQRRRRSWGQRLVLGTGVLTAVGFAAGATGIGYMYRKVEQIPRVELGHVLADPVASGEPRNILLVGVDDTEGIDATDPIHNEREEGPPLADTIMILRIDPADQQARVLSLPRDLWVTFPDQATARINTAIWRGDGSPDVLINLIGSELGIPIHNYVQIHFAGFRQIVDDIGGVPVHFDVPGRDQFSGLHVYDTGCVTLDADQALGYVRARHYEEYVDGEWQREGLSDLARVQRQQQFILYTVDRAINKGARNPGTMNSMVNAAVDGMTLDDELSVKDVVDLGRRFQSFDPDAMENYVLPVEDAEVGGADVLNMVQSDAEPILQLFRDAAVAEVPPAGEDPGDGGAPVDAPDAGDDGGQSDDGEGSEVQPTFEGLPSDVRVSVLNGSGLSGQATQASAELAEAGFVIADRDNAGQFGQAQTEVRYPAGLGSEAAFVERWLASGARLVESTDVGAVTVVTGEDWDGVLAEPRPPMGEKDIEKVPGQVLPLPSDDEAGGAEVDEPEDSGTARTQAEPDAEADEVEADPEPAAGDDTGESTSGAAPSEVPPPPTC